MAVSGGGAMTRRQLQAFVEAAWGARLERADLAQIQEQLLELQTLASPPPADGVFVIGGAPADYDTAMREFFGATLADDTEASFVQLWLTALELWVAIMVRQARSTDEA